MVVLDGNFALGCGNGLTLNTYISMYARKKTDAIMNEVLESITFVLAYPTVSTKELSNFSGL